MGKYLTRPERSGLYVGGTDLQDKLSQGFDVLQGNCPPGLQMTKRSFLEILAQPFLMLTCF